MEDSIEVILQDSGRMLPTSRPHPVVSACTGALLTGLYGVWSLFVMPGFRRIPWKLKVLEISFPFFLLFLFALSFKYQLLLLWNQIHPPRANLHINNNLLMLEHSALQQHQQMWKKKKSVSLYLWLCFYGAQHGQLQICSPKAKIYIPSHLDWWHVALLLFYLPPVSHIVLNEGWICEMKRD